MNLPWFKRIGIFFIPKTFVGWTIFIAGLAVLKPHAQAFVMDIHRKEEIKLCTKLDSLISINEKHRIETRKDLNRS